LVKIPVIELNGRDPHTAKLDYWAYYYGLASILDLYAGFDEAPKNCVLPLFLSHDPDILIRENPTTWTAKGKRQGDFENSAPAPLPRNHRPGTFEEKRVLKLIEAGFANIQDVGHPVLRGLCLSIGGYIASGYIPEQTALNEIDCLIESHSYLRKGVRGYKQTARDAINLGKQKPLILTNK
jgi:hypothetical protein